MERTVNLVLLAAVAGFYGSAQPISNRGNSFRVEPDTMIRLDANLVLVPVTVTDSRGRVVANLPQADFTLLEEKRPQDILSFSRETAPVSLGIVVDLSGSMANKIRATHTAVNEFLKNLDPEDEEFLVTFADRPELRLPLTSDPSGIYDALAGAAPHGSTALFDAVALAIRQMRGARNQRKVLFLVSDGGDNHSRLTERELRRLVEEEDVQIHAIGIHDKGASMDRLSEWSEFRDNWSNQSHSNRGNERDCGLEEPSLLRGRDGRHGGAEASVNSQALARGRWHV